MIQEGSKIPLISEADTVRCYASAAQLSKIADTVGNFVPAASAKLIQYPYEPSGKNMAYSLCS
jgi:hypothetical protein